MSFTKHTWTLGQLPAMTATELNRFEQALDDLYNRGGQVVSPALEAWRFVGATGEPVVFQNGHTNYGLGNANVAFFKDPFGIVRLKGLAKPGTVGSPMFTLPSGYLPDPGAERFAVVSNGAFGRVDIGGDGTVVGVTGSVYFDLSTISFRAEA